MYNREEKEAAFSIHYDEEGAIINVTSNHPNAEVTKVEHQELPPNVKTEKIVCTTIVIGEHNPRCRYIWVPGWGYVWVCW